MKFFGLSKREQRVQIYDVPSRKLRTIPARELAPGFVRVRVDGIEGDCWVDPSQLQKGPYQHGPFDEAGRGLLWEIKSALDEVYPMSLEEWEDGFRRDTNAEREIVIWLHIAKTYERLVGGKTADNQEKRDIFKLLLSCANNPRENAYAVAGTEKLSRPEAEAIMAEFYKKGEKETAPPANET